MRSKSLPIPLAAQEDLNGFELVRVWIASGSQHVSLATNVWQNPSAWGIMLVDLAKHIASAYQKTAGMNFDDTLKRIKDGFDAEWGTATDKPSGNLQN
jgi:hypothetical protein